MSCATAQVQNPPPPHPLPAIRGDGLQTPVGIQFLCLTFSKIVNVDTVDYKFPCLGNLPLRLCMSHQPTAISSCLHPRGLSPTWQSSSRNENRLIKPLTSRVICTCCKLKVILYTCESGALKLSLRTLMRCSLNVR